VTTKHVLRAALSACAVLALSTTTLCTTTAALPAAVAAPALSVTRVQGEGDLNDPAKKEIAMELVSSAENSSLDWKAQYSYIEDIGDGRGYTGGLIGFCSGTGDMLQLVRAYVAAAPGDPLAPFLPALSQVDVPHVRPHVLVAF